MQRRPGSAWLRGNARSSRHAALVLLALLFELTGCGGSSTDTDPSKFAPTAHLEVFATGAHRAGVDFDLITDGKKLVVNHELTAEQRVQRDDDVVIRGTASQLDRGLGEFDLSIEGYGYGCSYTDGTGGISTGGVAHGPGDVHVLLTAPKEKSVGLLTGKYLLDDYLDKVHCVNAGYTLNKGTFRVTLNVRNTAGRTTTTPSVQLSLA